MATTDEDLNQLEKDIRQLKIEYEQYFGGGRKRPPTEIEWRIDLLVKRYAERTAELKYAQRFRFNNLAQTSAKYKEMFRKKLQQREEGTVQRHFGAAAKAIEADRAKNEAVQAFRIACAEPDRETEKVEQLYQALVAAKQNAGEKVDKLSRENFREFVRKKTHDLRKQKGCKEVEYLVEVAGGQVKLKARVKE
ncbi:MAG TPA: MXAN_5187 C-terminal domain-containing protein [Candidatus Limnocylindria bacterium]|nr:MXAN_5187 C-terminal domain-containing protein [Candidatus Limnocylindria bacterium]